MKVKGILIGIHVLVWVGIILVFSPLPLGLLDYSVTPLNEVETSWFFVYGTVLNALLFYLFAHIALPRFLKHKNYFYFALINAGYLLAFAVVEGSIDMLFWYYLNPSGGMQYGMFLPFNLVTTALMLIPANFYGFAYAWFKEQQLRKTLEQEKLKAELSALKHQINPHFLFNVLNSLYALAFQNDDEPTAEGIAKLSRMMRYLLYESNDSRVPLSKELDYLGDYIDLQRLRINPQTQVDLQVQGNPSGVMIAPMILGTFVENAFKHGISATQSSFIHIRIALSEGELVFHTENSRHRHQSPKPKEVGGIGLLNVKKRLQLIYPKQYHLEVSEQNDTFTVTLRLKLI